MNKKELDSPKQSMTAERLKSLYELIGRMNSVYDLQELLEFVVDRALILTSGRRGLLMLGDDYDSELQSIAVMRGEDLDEKQVEEALEFVSTTVIKDVLKRGEPRLILDLRADERYEGITSTITHQLKKVRSVLAVPLKIEEQLVGLIYIDHPSQAIFGQGDLDFLSAFANQAALAINRAREHQRQIEKLTLLNELSRSVVQVLDLDEVLTRIVHEATRILNVETGSVLLLDEAESGLAFATSISNGQRVDIPTKLKKNQGIAGWVVSTGKPACVSNVSKDSRWFGEVETGFATSSLLAVPLKLNGRNLGVLQVLNKKSPSGFSQGDIALLSTFATSATIALENARLFREAQQAHQLRALNEIALALSSTLDLKKILHTGLNHSLKVLRTKIGVICLTNCQEQLGISPIRMSKGLPKDKESIKCQTRLLNSLTDKVLKRGVDEPLIVGMDEAQTEVECEALEGFHIQEIALAPIKVGNRISGSLIMMSKSSPSYGTDETNLLLSIARIIGLAVQNAIHYNQARTQAKHLALINQVGSALTSSLDLEHVLKVIIEATNTVLGTERTSVFLINSETNKLELRYSNEGEANIQLSAPWQGIAGWVATHDRPALVNDTHSDPRHLRQIANETGYQANSILCVPLKVEDRVIGVVEVLNKTAGQQFNHSHQTALIELTKWASIAIHNAHLFEDRVRAYSRLNAEQQRRIAAETRGAMAAVILEMAHTMNNVVGAIRVWASSLESSVQSGPNAPLSKFRKEITQIRQNAEEAIKLISNMTGPLKQASVAPTDVHKCLEDAIQSCWWPDNIHLKKHYGTDVPLVRANAKRLESVFHNLLSNAIQAMAHMGGEVQVKTTYMTNEGVQITITDNGPGIPAELQGRIFNPGVSLKSEGLGIGLWLVETFIHQFNGSIDCTSTPGKGASFTMTLEAMELDY